MSQKPHSSDKTDTWLADLYCDKKSKELPNVQDKPPETGGPKGLEPTRYGDWEKSGRCIDF